MFISKKNRIAVYSYLFKEGTLVVKKDFWQLVASDDIQVPNLEVISLLKSFKSRGFVRQTYNWQYYYFYLTNEGIEYLRAYLALPEDIVPATLKAASRPGQGGEKTAAGGDFKPEFSGEGGFGRGKNRDGYRQSAE
jgi:small subunit ribosomal protein S10e